MTPRPRVTGRVAALACILSAMAVALVAAGAARAHGIGGGAVTSAVHSVDPPVVGLDVSVEGGDDRLRIVWSGSGTLVVLGLSGEPFLRFSGRTVEENLASPTTWLSHERFSKDIPASARLGGPARWRRVSVNGVHAWYDQRIHLRTSTLPPGVGAGSDGERVIRRWTVPLVTADGQAAVRGRLVYAPGASSSTATTAIVVGVPIALLSIAGAAWALTRRRGRASVPGVPSV